MKLLYVEMNAEEMKANRTLMDALTDMVHGIVDVFNSPVSDDFGKVEESEEEDD